MARTTNTAPVTTGQMPDESEWDNTVIKPETIAITQPYGRVDGIDYERWAVAWEDAQQTPQRLTARAKSLDGKGYKEITGDWTVHGVNTPVRVWVIPRKVWEQRREAKNQALIDRVAKGLYPESALPSERTRRA